MALTQRQQQILSMLQTHPGISVRELAESLLVSEPTIRRDFNVLQDKGLLVKHYGGAFVNTAASDPSLPFFVRVGEKNTEKVEMGKKAAGLVHDGMVIMMDGSASAFQIIPYLTPFKDLIIITNGAKTAIALAERNIHTYCTGGQMILESFSYVGQQAEDFVRKINADLMFFSCRGLSPDGKMTDISIKEADLCRVMFQQSRKKILLCDSSKIGKTYFYNMGNLSDVDVIISDTNDPPEVDPSVRQKFLHQSVEHGVL